MRLGPVLGLISVLALGASGSHGQEPDRAPPTPPASPPPTATTPAAGADASAAANGPPRSGAGPTSANPAAVNIVTGNGALGRLLGIDEESGIRLGGIWVGDASGILSGGRNPGRWGFSSLTTIDLNLDMEKMFEWSGASFGTEFLQFSGGAVNEFAGAFPGFNSLEGPPPLMRQELYELWYRQSLFDDRLIFRIGKSVPTYDFNNVIKPVPVTDPTAAIPAVSGLLYTPVFVNPTMLGVIPGYYNSATGITTTLAPTDAFYMSYGFYDGNLARGRQTGLEGPHFNGYYFHIGEVGTAYRVGPQRKPGNFGVGVWGQTGKLNSFDGGTVNGALGTYFFGSQRLWFRHPDEDSSGVSGFYQFGANNSDALLARRVRRRRADRLRPRPRPPQRHLRRGPGLDVPHARRPGRPRLLPQRDRPPAHPPQPAHAAGLLSGRGDQRRLLPDRHHRHPEPGREREPAQRVHDHVPGADAVLTRVVNGPRRGSCP